MAGKGDGDDSGVGGAVLAGDAEPAAGVGVGCVPGGEWGVGVAGAGVGGVLEGEEGEAVDGEGSGWAVVEEGEEEVEVE